MDRERPGRVIVEIACFNVEAAVLAQDAGADRIELCAGPGEGGTTPSLGTLRAVRQLCHVPVHPIVRPRGGDFCYTDTEFAVMLEDLRAVRDLGFPGVVVGVLAPDGTVDEPRLSRLVSAAGPMSVTFHRAFDVAADPMSGLEAIIRAGCARLLTSGQGSNASAGADLISALVAAAGDRLIVMAGGGVRSDGVRRLVKATGVGEVHSSGQPSAPRASAEGPARGARRAWLSGDSGSPMPDRAEVAALAREAKR